LIPGLEKDALERRLMGQREADEAVVAVADFAGRREDHDVALDELGLHRVAHHAHGERVRIVQVGATDVIIGDADGIIEIVELDGIARRDLVDHRNEPARRQGPLALVGAEIALGQHRLERSDAALLVDRLFEQLPELLILGLARFVLLPHVRRHAFQVGDVQQEP